MLIFHFQPYHSQQYTQYWVLLEQGLSALPINMFYQPDFFQNDSLYLLPAFDELLIGYTNRTATINSVDNPKAISNNGMFRPIIVENGRVTGVWKRTSQKTKVMIELTFFSGVSDFVMNALESEIKKQALFLSKETELVFSK